MKTKRPDLQLRVRILLGRDIAVGPGKADLLEAILKTNSIAAAAREMGMSYKRAWFLIAAASQHSHLVAGFWLSPVLRGIGPKKPGIAPSICGASLFV
jgi:hypothetical protein